MLHKFSYIFLAKAALLLCGLLSFSQALAQNPTEGMISPLVGPNIDQIEYQLYGLETILDIPADEIDSLRILSRGEDAFVLFYYLADGSTKTDEIEKAYLRGIKNHIENQGRALLIRWEEYRQQAEAGESERIFIQMRDGSLFRGNISAMNPYMLKLSRGSGDRMIRMEDIQAIGPANADPEGDAVKDIDMPPGYMRYFFSPNALPTRKGDSYIGVTRLAYHRGLTNQIGITVAPGLLTLLYSAVIPDFTFVNGTISLKYGQRINPKFHIGANLSMQGGTVNLLGTTNFSYIGGWGTLLGTFGTYDNNLTIGGGLIGLKGYGDLNSPVTLIPEPTLTLGGTVRVGENLSLTTENWTWGTSNSIGGVVQNGFRFYFFSAGAKIFLPYFYVNAGLTAIAVQQRSTTGSQVVLATPIPIPFIGVYISL